MNKNSKIGKTYKHHFTNKNRMFLGDLTGPPDGSFHTLSPRYDSFEECRVSYSLFWGVYYESNFLF